MSFSLVKFTDCVLLWLATPGNAQRVPVATTTTEDATETKADDDADKSDSDAENQLNPDEYEDDTTEFEQSEAAADTQTEARLLADLWQADISRQQFKWLLNTSLAAHCD